MNAQPWSGRRLHLVGLGGAGMRGYARVATQLGARVSGSDRADGPALAALRAGARKDAARALADQVAALMDHPVREKAA